MRNRAFIALLAAALACLGATVIITGIITDDKAFYAIAAVCMGIASICLWLISRPTTRLGR